MVLLGGEVGLRSGEIQALEWSSIDFRRCVLAVERSEYKGHVNDPTCPWGPHPARASRALVVAATEPCRRFAA